MFRNLLRGSWLVGGVRIGTLVFVTPSNLWSSTSASQAPRSPAQATHSSEENNFSTLGTPERSNRYPAPTRLLRMTASSIAALCELVRSHLVLTPIT